MVTQNENKPFEVARQVMVQKDLQGRDITDAGVLYIMGSVPREKFVPQKYASSAYDDCPLPIGVGQTISQPYIVALMTQCLKLDKQCEVLELGTGSGYQTAILAKLARKVCTIEVHNQLSESAQTVLGNLGFTNIEFFIGDGSKGWPQADGPVFDRIIITAAVPEIPQPIIDQLKDGGIIVAPTGGPLVQNLVVCEKIDGKLKQKTICGCRFVKLIGEHGFRETD
jgi:protein-L-isoaspartate(D-aspartate) O-methyltransferase